MRLDLYTMMKMVAGTILEYMKYIQQTQHTHLPNPCLPLRGCTICTIPQLFYQSSPTLTFQLIFKIHKKSAHIVLTTDVNHTCCPLIITLTHVMK